MGMRLEKQREFHFFPPNSIFPRSVGALFQKRFFFFLLKNRVPVDGGARTYVFYIKTKPKERILPSAATSSSFDSGKLFLKICHVLMHSSKIQVFTAKLDTQDRIWIICGDSVKKEN